MAKVKNITGDVLSLFRADAPPVQPGDEVIVRDENFVGRAWPKSTWDLVDAPALDDHIDASSDEAWLYVEAPETPEPADVPADDNDTPAED